MPPPSPPPPPKAILFDIGGVCVISPMRAILDYELSQNIPPGWVNFSISRTSPNGSWHKLERGEIKMNADFFRAFNADLRRPDLWRQYCAKVAAKSAYDVPGSKVEALVAGSGAKETSSEPTPALSAAGVDVQAPKLPPLPALDAEWLFWEMMRISRQPDPYMFPALRKLKASGRFLVAALSNTSIFPDGHPYNDPPQNPDMDVKGTFDVFVSSAHVGLRKPDPRIYELAMGMMGEKYRAVDGAVGGTVVGRGGGLRPEDVVFLDDIGENLKQARKLGMRTIKVGLGDTKSAVKELERITGMDLLEDTAKL